MRKGLKVRSSMECVRIQKHSGVREYKAVAGVFKNGRGNQSLEGLTSRVREPRLLVRGLQGLCKVLTKRSVTEISKYIAKVGKVLSGTYWRPYWCHPVSE